MLAHSDTRPILPQAVQRVVGPPQYAPTCSKWRPEQRPSAFSLEFTAHIGDHHPYIKFVGLQGRKRTNRRRTTYYYYYYYYYKSTDYTDASLKLRNDDRKSPYYNRGIKADKRRNLKLKMLELIRS